jgi:hypothetical protein
MDSRLNDLFYLAGQALDKMNCFIYMSLDLL